MWQGRDSFLWSCVPNASEPICRSAVTVKEPGCRQIDILVLASNPNHVFLYEVYDNEAALQAHRATDHFKKYAATTANMVAKREVGAMSPVALNAKGHHVLSAKRTKSGYLGGVASGPIPKVHLAKGRAASAIVEWIDLGPPCPQARRPNDRPNHAVPWSCRTSPCRSRCAPTPSSRPTRDRSSP